MSYNPNLNINDSKIIIISDTHFCSTYENVSYLESVYSYALKNNIKTILHAGDLLQGLYRPVSKKYRTLEKQVEHLETIYPYDSSITNHILLGNHDFNIFNKDIEQCSIISRSDLNFLGIRKIYFNWNNHIFEVFHRCPKYTEELPFVPTILKLYGHSHKFAVHKSMISIPTLSDDLKEETNPGFLVASIDDQNIYLELIEFNPNISNPQMVLKKSLLPFKR